MTNPNEESKKYYRIPGLKLNWQSGLFLLLVFTIVRFWIVLQANITGSYQYVSFIFIIMILFPFLFMTTNGRKKIGIRKSFKIKGILSALCFGLIAGFLIYVTFNWINIYHPYTYIAASYQNIPENLDQNRLIFFLIYTGISISFSPFGEEFFYRGVVHESFKADFGNKKATVIDSAAFSLVHLAHFGIIYQYGHWNFLPISSIFWILLLFVTCLGFNYSRKITGSIWGAVLAHVGFNVAMNYTIFYCILD